MAEFFANIWDSVVSFFVTYHWVRDTLDILLVALAIYSVIRLVRDSRTEQLLKGVLLLLAAYAVARLLGLTTLIYLMNVILDNALILLVIIFQPELRRMLESAGHSRLSTLNIFGSNPEQAEQTKRNWQQAIASICAGIEMLQRQRMGALIVLERSTKLGEIISSGTVVDAAATPELIGNMFFNKAPLHDGAVIIRDGRVYAAGCFLPLSDNLQLSRELGTRHRAGIGMSENSDAVVVIVSEETGSVSVAVGGMLKRHLQPETLENLLRNELLPQEKDATEKNKFDLLALLKLKKNGADDENEDE